MLTRSVSRTRKAPKPNHNGDVENNAVYPNREVLSKKKQKTSKIIRMHAVTFVCGDFGVRQIPKRNFHLIICSIFGVPIIFWMILFWLLSQPFLLSSLELDPFKDLNLSNKPTIRKSTPKRMEKANLDAPTFDIAIPFCGKGMVKTVCKVKESR